MIRTIFAVIAMVLFLGVGANIAIAEETDWWNDIVLNVPEIKLGYIGLDADENSKVIEGEDGITWDISASLPVVNWRKFSGDLGVSKAGVGFAALTVDLVNLDDVDTVSVPGSQFVRVNAGVFAGKDFDGTDDGFETSNNWMFGFVVNFFGFGS